MANLKLASPFRLQVVLPNGDYYRYVVVPKAHLTFCSLQCNLIASINYQDIGTSTSNLVLKHWNIVSTDSLTLPVGTPPPWGDRFVQKIEWLRNPPPLNLRAGCNAIMALTSPTKKCTRGLVSKWKKHDVLGINNQWEVILTWRTMLSFPYNPFT